MTNQSGNDIQGGKTPSAEAGTGATGAEINAEVLITVRDNGPYTVTGPARIIDLDGNEYDISAKKRVSLCRCGASTTKPFCDGTHSRIGFQAAERAVREEGGLP